ncbi:MAG: helix-turn-helix transcriptional regulator [Paracoccus sp. (in: a-proteobacteria)]|uniref:helix-turn-helix transcriptional regulator n=1 Tax=Paracoccus sp. TaxID=267 RepID=UPI0026E09D46|nr:helix-turn-helix transcriptional regulator [Paracoccus sp. (in: a-proteobacteria)]MDO5613703.1 helix-turn-helix transcriptional regulator [Paracoccus sp. (in: a-proteobacteria)]
MNKPVHIDADGVSRHHLIARLLDADQQIALIEAPAGCGKSWVMAALSRFTGVAVQRGATPPDPAPLMLWDLDRTPAVSALPDLPPDCRLVIACRPGTMVPGLARVELYGRLLRIGPDDLLFTADDLTPHPDAARIIAMTGGWPCLVPPLLAGWPGIDRNRLAEFLGQELLAPLPVTGLIALRALIEGKAPPPALLHGLPFAYPPQSQTLHPVLTAVRPLLPAAIASALSDRNPVALANAEMAAGNLPQAIVALQSAGLHDRALTALRDGGGWFFFYRYGADAHDRMLDGFPADLLESDDLLVICRALRAVKQGEPALGRRIMAARWGTAALSPITFCANRALSDDTRVFRLLFETWDDAPANAAYFERAYDLLADLPDHSHLLRGAIYNSIMEAQFRRRRFAAAERSAIRAARHFAAGEIPLLGFYTALNRGIIALATGDPATARIHARDAAAGLKATSWTSPGDQRILTLLDSCIACETGQSEPLARFLLAEMDDLTQAEIWPALAELALIYGTQALCEHDSTQTARQFLERWRQGQGQDHNGAIPQLANIREVALLQNSGRWQEAAARMRLLPGSISADADSTATQQHLSTLDHPDKLAMAQLWLRQMAHDRLPPPALSGLIQAILMNPGLTARQRAGAEIWLASVLYRQNRHDDAAATLIHVLTLVWQSGVRTVLNEERGFINDMLAARQLRDRLERTEPIRNALRWLTETRPASPPPDNHGLTRQELRILETLTEGLTNKAIAKALGLSEATVKFHLINVYRKLNCKSRAQAVAAARAHRLLG